MVNFNFFGSGGGGSSADAVKVIQFTLALATASSNDNIPANSKPLIAEIQITSVYDGGATIAIGRTGSTSLLQATTDNNPASADTYVVDIEPNIAWGASALPVLATITGAPTTGAAQIRVWYVETVGD